LISHHDRLIGLGRRPADQFLAELADEPLRFGFG